VSSPGSEFTQSEPAHGPLPEAPPPPYLDSSAFGDRDLPHAIEAVEVGLWEARGQDGTPALCEVATTGHWERKLWSEPPQTPPLGPNLCCDSFLCWFLLLGPPVQPSVLGLLCDLSPDNRPSGTWTLASPFACIPPQLPHLTVFTPTHRISQQLGQHHVLGKGQLCALGHLWGQATFPGLLAAFPTLPPSFVPGCPGSHPHRLVLRHSTGPRPLAQGDTRFLGTPAGHSRSCTRSG
jgi:hypothetical protein